MVILLMEHRVVTHHSVCDFRAHAHIDLGDFHCESWSLFSRSCFLCRFGMMFVMPSSCLACYT